MWLKRYIGRMKNAIQTQKVLRNKKNLLNKEKTVEPICNINFLMQRRTLDNHLVD